MKKCMRMLKRIICLRPWKNKNTQKTKLKRREEEGEKGERHLYLITEGGLSRCRSGDLKHLQWNVLFSETSTLI